MEAKALRARARQSLGGNWPLSIGIAVVACLLGGMITGQTFLPDVEFDFITRINQTLQQGVRLGNWRFSLNLGVPGLLAFLVGGPVQLGYAVYLLKQHDGQAPTFQDLFSQFHRFGQGFAQHFLRGLYVALWSLLLVIPGIIAGYSYAMTPFLMAEDPGLTATDAITASKEMMNGHKAELFFLDLSFFGWFFLAALTGNLGNILLNPYTNAARAAFYRQLRQNPGIV